MPEQREIFPVKKPIKGRGQLLGLEQGCIMGILNITPDSFYDGGAYTSTGAQLRKTGQMLAEGAHIIDIGGYSTRPGANEINEDEELNRVLPVIEKLINEFPGIIISIDTFRAAVAKKAVEAGAAMINDISGGEDENMFSTVAGLQVPYVLMHKKGNPANMQDDPQYEDVVKEVVQYLSLRVERLRAMGVNDVIVDPGFGFGKTLEHNYRLLKKMYLLRMLGCPVMAGVSRKRMINRLLGIKPEDALNGTSIVNTLALLDGADILRVHDVKEAAEALKIVNYYRGII